MTQFRMAAVEYAQHYLFGPGKGGVRRVGERMTSPTRRTVLKTAALATGTLAMPFVRGAQAAGKLSMGFWDHWVPGANDTMTKLCHEWADKEKVDITIDFITTQGDKLILTAAAEAQAKSGHDILSILTWYAIGNADNLERVDDIVGVLGQQTVTGMDRIHVGDFRRADDCGNIQVT